MYSDRMVLFNHVRKLINLQLNFLQSNNSIIVTISYALCDLFESYWFGGHEETSLFSKTIHRYVWLSFQSFRFINLFSYIKLDLHNYFFYFWQGIFERIKDIVNDFDFIYMFDTWLFWLQLLENVFLIECW